MNTPARAESTRMKPAGVSRCCAPATSGPARRAWGGLTAGLPYFLQDQRPAGFLGRAVPQRYPGFDLPQRVTGLVMGLSHFRLPYKVKALDGTMIERNKTNLNFAPFDLPAAHIFKIGADGLMHEIEAMGFTAPYNAPTGWE